MTRTAKVGSRAPAFSLRAVSGSGDTFFDTSLDEYLDRWLVLLFYPRDFSLVCPTELTAISERYSDFSERGCDVLGISTDDADTHAQWLTTSPEQGGLEPLRFALASDTDGQVCTQYGVYLEQQRVALRGLFIVDPNGVLQYQLVHSLSVGRSSSEVLRVLDALQSGGLCTGERKLGQPTIDVASQLVPNRVVGPYRIESKIGVGACGTVFKAQDKLLERPVALKVLRTDQAGSSDNLLAEARAAAALSHPNVCLVYAVDTSNGVDMIVMEFVDGQSVADRLEDGPFDTESVVRFTRQIARGMTAAHDAGVIHGDLKPANLMITRSNSVKVMDFGLARRLSQSVKPDDTTPLPSPSNFGITGTPRYMSPEQARGEGATPKSDVFSLGLIVFEMLTGQPAVSGAGVLDVLRNIEQFDATDLLTQTPEPFREILQSMLAARSSERNISMRQLVERLS